MEGRLLHLERFYNEYDDAADKSWRITNNLESLGVAQISKTPQSLIELECSSSKSEKIRSYRKYPIFWRTRDLKLRMSGLHGTYSQSSSH